MFAFQDTRGPVDVAFTDRHGGISGGPFASLNLAEPHRATRRRPSRQNLDVAVAAAFTGDRRPRRLVADAPGARRRRARRRRRRRRRPPPVADALVTAAPGRRAGGPGRRLRAGAARRPRGRRASGRRTPAAPGLVAGVVPAHGRARCATLGAADVAGLGRAARVRRLLRGARADARRGRGRRCPRPSPRPRGARRARHRRRRRRPAAPPTGVEVVDASTLHHRGRRPVLLPPPGRRLRPAGRPGPGAAVSAAHNGPMTDRTTELAANASRARSASRIAGACARSGRSADEVTLTVVTKFFPASDVRLLAELGVRHVGENRHQEARGQGGRVRRPRPRVALHRRPAEQQGGRGRVVRRRGRVRRPGQAAARALRAAPTSAAATLDVLVQVDLDPDGAARDRPRGCRARRRRWPSPSRSSQPRASGCAGVMAVAPLGADPVPAFARLAELAAEVRRRRPGRDVGLGGDERRPRGGRRIRRDTRADRQRGARWQARPDGSVRAT